MKTRNCVLVLLLIVLSGWSTSVDSQTLYLNNSAQSNAQYVTLATEGSGDAVLKPVRITIEMWAKTSAWNQAGGGSYASLISNTSSSGYDIYMDGTNLYFEAWAESYGYKYSSCAISSLSNNQWYHIAGTWNGTQSKLYINGILVNSSSALGSETNIVYASATHTILGCEAYSAGGPEGEHYFDGYIKDVRVWNVARTESDIRDNMHTQLAGTESGLIGYYKLDETSGTTAANAVSGGPTGTLYHSPTWVSATVPMSSLQSGYTTSKHALWGATGTGNTHASNGLLMAVGSTLTDENHIVFGNNNINGISTGDLPSGVVVRSARIWYIEKIGTVTPNITIDLAAATGNSFTPGSAEDYRLLYRSGTNGTFTDLAAGNSITDNSVTFNSVSLSTGYYAAGGTSSGSLPVELTSFTATATHSSAQLRWNTATEENNYGFEVERRKIGDERLEMGVTNPQSTISDPSWCKIGFVAGAGTSNAPEEYSFTDAKLSSGRYAYRLKQVDIDGLFKYSQSVEVEIGVPEEFALGQNYPNPFNPTTTIQYEIPSSSFSKGEQGGFISLKVYDVLGKEVAMLVNEMKEPGSYEVQFDASRLASGIYFYRLNAGNNSLVKKLILMK